MPRNDIIARLLAIGFIVSGTGRPSVDPEGDDQLRHPSIGYGSLYVATNRLAANGNYRGFLDGVEISCVGPNGGLVYQDGNIELALQALEGAFGAVTV
jgi:hypothetical protein